MELFAKQKVSLPSFEYFHNKTDEPFDVDTLHEHLKSIVVIGQPLFCIPELRRLKALEDLWLVECSLHNADQVQNGEHLQKLYLSSNVLTRIPPLTNLQHLRVLWLPGNLIEKINADELPPSLQELNLADNRISEVKDSFRNCVNLETLNISANPISSIFELCHLQRLRRLKHLWLCDPLYELTSITKLVNYRSFVVNCFPLLKQLDTHIIEEREAELTKVMDASPLTWTI